MTDKYDELIRQLEAKLNEMDKYIKLECLNRALRLSPMNINGYPELNKDNVLEAAKNFYYWVKE